MDVSILTNLYSYMCKLLSSFYKYIYIYTHMSLTVEAHVVPLNLRTYTLKL